MWFDEAVLYQIYPLGLCGAPEYQDDVTVPRIRRLLDWVDHIKKLGADTVLLNPVFDSDKHGYDTRDYNRLDPRLGTNEDLAAVCRAFHEAGVRVMLDGVFNHVGRGFWAFRDVQEHGQASPYCGWFHDLNFGGPSPMGDPFWYTAWQGHYELVKLNLKNPEVRDHLLGAVGMWMDRFHIDGLRLDAADCVDFDFFRALKHYTKSRDPEFWLMGEIIHGDYARWANPEMLDSVTNYECWKGNWSAHNTKNYFEIAHSLHRQAPAASTTASVSTTSPKTTTWTGWPVPSPTPPCWRTSTPSSTPCPACPPSTTAASGPWRASAPPGPTWCCGPAWSLPT